MKRATTIGEYLIQQLHAGGVRHVFGIPGDYVLGFYDQLARSKLVQVINTCDEQGAGFAADAYARVRGLGAVCVTYCVGGLKVANTTAGAFAEKSPVVIISGAPGIKEREKNPLLHHKVREFDTQKKVFEQLTVASTVLSDPQTAFQEIDRVLHAAIRYKRPVYIELPRDLVFTPGIPHHRPAELHEESDPETLRAALAEAEAMINRARRPVILADVEVHRFALQDTLLNSSATPTSPSPPPCSASRSSASSTRFTSASMKARSAAMTSAATSRAAIASSCSARFSPISTSAFSPRTSIRSAPSTRTARNSPSAITPTKTSASRTSCAGCSSSACAIAPSAKFPGPRRSASSASNAASQNHRQTPLPAPQRFSQRRYRGRRDVGDALFGAADLFIRHRTDFGPAYYASMGFAVPASVGAQLANPELRPLVLVGDGAFQMTGLELSTVARYGLNPVVIVLNNFGYGTERPMQDGPLTACCPGITAA